MHHRYPSLLCCLCALSSLAFGYPVLAEDRVIPEARMESSRGVALGTGSRASALSTQAQAENPANLVGGGVYHLESFMAYQPTFKRFAYGAAVVDSMTSRLAAGISARGIAGDNAAGDNSGWEVRLGLGFPFGDVFSIGIAGRYARFQVSDDRAVPERKRPAASRAVPDRTFKLNALTLDAALTLRPLSIMSISALGYNLIDTESPLAPLMVGGAVAFGFDEGWSVGGDVLFDMNTHKYFDGPKLQAGGGAEFLISGVVPLRGGYLYDQGRQQQAVTTGLGYIDKSFGVHLSLRQVVSGGKETTLMAALQYFVH